MHLAFYSKATRTHFIKFHQIIMTTNINYKPLYYISVLILALVLCASTYVLLSTTEAQAQAQVPTTMVFDLEKKFSGPVPSGYLASQFTFNISTIGAPIALTAFTPDSANGTVSLPVGTYTISENGPVGFVPSDWTVQWSGAGCQNQTGLTTTITITEQDLGKVNFGCRADNQWKPKDVPKTGKLLVSKVIVGTTTVPASNFAFTYTGAIGNTSFEADGTNAVTVATGTYSVTEAAAAGYTTTYNNCSDIVVLANATTTACVITNTKTVNQYSQASYYAQSAYGNGDPTFLVFGYVWHDKNESDIWEKSEPNPADNEVDLDAWVVNITNGSTTLSTTTDPTGYYFFKVPVGTWTITEVLQTDWNQTFPNATSHVVNITNPLTHLEKPSFFAQLINYLIPTALAQVPTTYGPFDFGNVFKGSSNYSQGSYGGGSYSQGSYGGGSNGGGGGSSSGSKKKSAPVPQVLGAATTALPVGAPNTGAGGSSQTDTLPSLVAIATVRTVLKKSK
jgi:uncharacterized membrane protein YgcG